RTDAGRAGGRPRDDPLRRHEAPEGARGRGSRRHPPGRPGEASLPEPGPDPADPRPLDRQVHRGPRQRAPRSQGATGGGDGMTTATTPEVRTTQVYQLFIKATPERIWEAITKPELVKLYYHNCRLESEIEAGGRWRAWSPDHPKLWVDAEILEFDPPRRLAHGWRSLYNDELADEPESRVTWEIEPQEGGYSLVTVVHDRLESSP